MCANPGPGLALTETEGISEFISNSAPVPFHLAPAWPGPERLQPEAVWEEMANTLRTGLRPEGVKSLETPSLCRNPCEKPVASVTCVLQPSLLCSLSDVLCGRVCRAYCPVVL